MLRRLRPERGQGLIELVVTMVVISLALLGLGAAYDAGFLSLHHAASKLAAANLAQKQLELYAAIPYASLGLDTTTFATVTADDPTYVSDEAGLTPTKVSDVTLSCGTASYCLPEQCTPAATCTYPVTLSEDPVGSDGRHYKVETFIRKVSQTVSGGSVNEIDITVIVRDPNTSGSPIVYETTTAFDCADSSGNCT